VPETQIRHLQKKENRYEGRTKGTTEQAEKSLSKPKEVSTLQELGAGSTTHQNSASLGCDTPWLRQIWAYIMTFVFEKETKNW
jgi:hypothetical protein